MEISSISGLPKGRVGSEESAQLGAAEEFRTEGESTLTILGQSLKAFLSRCYWRGCQETVLPSKVSHSRAEICYTEQLPTTTRPSPHQLPHKNCCLHARGGHTEPSSMPQAQVSAFVYPLYSQEKHFIETRKTECSYRKCTGEGGIYSEYYIFLKSESFCLYFIYYFYIKQFQITP